MKLSHKHQDALQILQKYQQNKKKTPKDKEADKSYFYTFSFIVDESLGRLVLSHTVWISISEHYHR